MSYLASLRTALPALIVAAALTVGCAHTDPARFYTLTAAAPHSALRQAAGGPAIIIAPVQVATYLDRQQIVNRVDESEVQLGEFDRWAEPLADGIGRVLAENLSCLLASERVSDTRATEVGPADFRVLVSVIGFDQVRGREVALTARWSVVGGAGEELIADRLSTARVQISGGEVASVVSAHSQALAMLSEEIAAVIRAASARSGAD